MIAVVPVRAGELPAGAQEACEEAGGRVLLVGWGTAAAVGEITGHAHDVAVCELPAYRPGPWAVALARVLSGEDVVLLPASPDGRDLAPRLAVALGRPLLAPAHAVGPDVAHVGRGGGLVLEEVLLTVPVVATLQPGVRGTERPWGQPPTVRTVHVELPPAPSSVTTVEELPADPDTVELAEARRIVAAGIGVGSAECVGLLARVASAMGASLGATRVVTDTGWLPFERQIGTTGVAVDPDLYVAVGISGAAQHVGGIGSPGTVVSVNLDAGCPMMALADLAVVSDAPAVVRELAALLGVAAPEPEAVDA